MNQKLKIGILALISLTFLNAFAFAQENIIDAGKKVKMHFTMKTDGQILEDTFGKAPFEFTFGEHPMIPGIEEALKGAKVGDKRQLNLPPEKAFGSVDPKAVAEIAKSQFEEKNIQPGMVFNGRNANGQMLKGIVKEVKKDTVVLDFNHPLAGKTLDVNLEVVEIA